MGLFDSLEKKFEELKKDVGLGGNKQQPLQQGYPGAQPQPHYYPPPQGYQQPPPPQWGAQPPGQYQQQQWGPPPPQPNHYGQQAQQWSHPPGPQSPPIPSNKPGQQAPPPIPSGKPPHGPGQTPHQPTSGNPTDYWQPVFHPSRSVGEDFDQKIGNGPDGWGNQELEHYTASPANSFYTPNNKLVLRAISNPSDPNPQTRYTSARLVSHQRLERPRGCLTAVLTVPSAPGIWPAFWLLPAEPFTWPYEGEVDVAESWNAEATNHTCIHWGHFNGEDHDKHRVMETPLPGIAQRTVKYEFAWEQDEASGRGRYIWWIDGRPVMKCHIPEGFRRMRDWTVLLNVAMGGNVCKGVAPPAGSYDMVVHELRMSGECDGGWGRFESSWHQAPEGNRM